jgi:predicted deacylase
VDFLGERVEKGQPLFDIYSPDLLTAQQEYLIALQQQKGLNSSYPQGRQPAAGRLAHPPGLLGFHR